jgi:hypothetical protein
MGRSSVEITEEEMLPDANPGGTKYPGGFPHDVFSSFPSNVVNAVATQLPMRHRLRLARSSREVGNLLRQASLWREINFIAEFGYATALTPACGFVPSAPPVQVRRVQAAH